MALIEQDQVPKDQGSLRDDVRREPPSPAGAEQKPSTKPKPLSTLTKLRRSPFIVVGVIIVIVAILIGGLLWWLTARHYESTDDAYIDARTVQISAQIAGQVESVPVTDNQSVTAGTPLVKIDPRNYRAALAEAKAQLEQAHAQVANLSAQIDAQQANVDSAQLKVTQAQAALQFSEEEQKRYQDLLRSGSGTQQRAQQAESDLTQKRAALAGSQADEVAAEKQLAVLRTQRDSAVAQVDAAQAGLDKAQTDLDRTTITSPADGRVARLSAAKGYYAQPGQALMSVVPNTVWITANFKETQLNDMRVGQPVDIEIDAYPDRDFHGHVDSIQAGSGAAFSLLPSENATGNFVKIVQRVPVKIVFDHAPQVYLGPGMSVVATVKVR